jgi:hypothetical protein
MRINLMTLICMKDGDENSDDILAGIQDLMERCKVVQDSTTGTNQEEEEDDEDEETQDLPDDADADMLLATIEGLMAKCEQVQRIAKGVQETDYWAAQMAEQHKALPEEEEEHEMD